MIRAAAGAGDGTYGGALGSMGLFSKKRNPGQPFWFGQQEKEVKQVPDGWRFTLKGSPRHFDDVRAIIDSDAGAVVYFGEALTYERGAGVALWRVSARSFGWLSTVYDWWAEMERVETILFTIHLYLPGDLKYPALNLREHTPFEVENYIRANAPRSEAEAERLARRQ